MGLYVEQFNYRFELSKEMEEMQWARFRIQWADFRNAHRGRKSKVVRPTDLIKLSFDEAERNERVAKYHQIDLDAVRKKLGSRLKKKKRGK